MPGLEVYVPGDVEGIDAAKVTAGLNRLLSLLNSLGPAERWTFKRIQLGSLDACIGPLEVEADEQEVSSRFEYMIAGLAEAERGRPPIRWPHEALEDARDLMDSLGSVRLRSEGSDSEVWISSDASDAIRAALRRRRPSLGSVTGSLDSVGVHRKREAGLWTADQHKRRVKVYFEADQQDRVAESIGKRVRVQGELTRDYCGRPMSIRMRSLVPLHGERYDVSLPEASERYQSLLDGGDAEA